MPKARAPPKPTMRWYPFMRDKQELGLMGLLVLLDHCGPIPESILTTTKSWSPQDYLIRRRLVEQGFLVHCVVKGEQDSEPMWCINPDISRDVRDNTLDMLVGHSMLGSILRDVVLRIMCHHTGPDTDDIVVAKIGRLVRLYYCYVDRHEAAKLADYLGPWIARNAAR